MRHDADEVPRMNNCADRGAAVCIAVTVRYRYVRYVQYVSADGDGSRQSLLSVDVCCNGSLSQAGSQQVRVPDVPVHRSPVREM